MKTIKKGALDYKTPTLSYPNSKNKAIKDKDKVIGKWFAYFSVWDFPAVIKATEGLVQHGFALMG